MKILKNAKALSPVVASIILIAVTVAVSIAVAAWMGALSFNFMGTEQITFTNSAICTTNANITVRNPGSGDLSIQEVRVDGNVVTITGITTPYLLAKGALANFTITRGFTQGVQYEFTVVTAKGNTFGPLIKTVP
jgi:flagellin-like protein